MSIPTKVIITLFSLFLFSCNLKGAAMSPKISNFELEEVGVEEIQQAYKDKRYTIKQVVQLYIQRIEELDPKINSIIIVNPDALRIAEELDQEMAAGKSRGPLHGIPIIIKDNIDTHDKMPTTAGSRILKNSYPKQDSWVAKKLREAGAIILAKANLSEWANYRSSFSSSGWSGVGGQTNNPYVLDRNPCGSSSGSAAAVSASLATIAIGTETWGSIICPANANGVVGIKPTVGLWSRSGIVPLSATTDTAGPMARTVGDAAILLGAITGIDPVDKITITSKGKSHTDYTQFLKNDGLKGKRIGFLKTAEGKHFKVDLLAHQAVAYIKSQGAEVIELDSIVTEMASANADNVFAYEFKDGLEKYLARLGDDAPATTLAEVIDATKADPVEMQFFNIDTMENSQSKADLETQEYKDAVKAMLLAFRENGIDKVMDEHSLDAIISPSGGPAWKTDHINGDNFGFSSSVNAALSGYPSITVPMGFIGEVPVGISFTGRAWSEPLLLEIAYAYEQGTKHRKPPKFLVTD